MHKKMEKKMEKCSRETWLEAALLTLKRGGIEAVRVEPLARELGVTKGSFYWHFSNRNDLLDQLFTYWSRHMNEEVFRHINSLQMPPGDKLVALLEETLLCGRGRYDAAIRAWSAIDSAIAARLHRIDRKRLSFIAMLFREAGFTAATAELRAKLLYGYMVGEVDIAHLSKKHRRQGDIGDIASFMMSP